ncbi:MAG: Lpg1974 family pore-forming outer membrane protein [Legionella sp.]|nr:Lpg1974 family pore-forming outer membrane protein [Legionella sp.]
MFSFKKTALAALVLSCSTAFAGAMGEQCTPGDVTVPCEHPAWALSGQALYLQINHNNNLFYLPFFGQNNDIVYRDLSGKWNWGFQLEGSYNFNTGNDLTLNWYHLDGRNNLDAPFIHFKIDQEWDAVTGEVGQLVDFNANIKMRFHGGVQYAHISSDMTFLQETFISGFVLNFARNMVYNGFGPRTGLDMNYVFGSGIGLYAKTATALLIGSTKFKNQITDDGRNYLGSKTNLVPELEAKLGANYTRALEQGTLILDAGYMCSNYFKALGATFSLAEFRSSSFSVSGPYVGLKYVGSI